MVLVAMQDSASSGQCLSEGLLSLSSQWRQASPDPSPSWGDQDFLRVHFEGKPIIMLPARDKKGMFGRAFSVALAARADRPTEVAASDKEPEAAGFFTSSSKDGSGLQQDCEFTGAPNLEFHLNAPSFSPYTVTEWAGFCLHRS